MVCTCQPEFGLSRRKSFWPCLASAQLWLVVWYPQPSG